MNLRKFQLVYLKGKISTGASWSISKIHITAIKHLKTSAWMPFQAKTLMFMIFSLCILKLVQTCNHLLQAPTGKHEFSISVDVFQSVVRCFNYIFLIRPHDKQHLFNFFYFLQKLSNFSPLFYLEGFLQKHSISFKCQCPSTFKGPSQKARFILLLI